MREIAKSQSVPPSHEADEQRFVEAALTNPNVGAIVERMPKLGLREWYLTAGGLFQPIWNVLDGRAPTSGIKDYDVFYFDDSDLSYEAEDRVIQEAAALFADLEVDVEVRNEARVHLWYEDKFGTPAKPFANCRDAIDHFASTTCCYGLTVDGARQIGVYAPHGFQDLFEKVLRPNPVLAPRHVYEAKAKRWQSEWPTLTSIFHDLGLFHDRRGSGPAWV